ncbi:testis-expressed sequence 264 protein-like protein, partial [Leptotrombidium deliense]
MSLELWLLFIIIALIVTVFGSLIFFGLFYEIEVKAGHTPIQVNGRRFAFKSFVGPYSEAGSAFTELFALLASKLPEFIDDSLTTIGVYYDDPNTVEDMNHCKYIVGVLMPNEDNALFAQIERLLSDKEYKFATLPTIDHVVHTSFPYRGALSIIIAMRRVYPMLKQFITEHNLCAHPAIEFYRGDQIYFILPLAKQDQFYFIHDDVDDDLSDRSSQNGTTADDETKDSSKETGGETNGSQSDNAMSSRSSRSSFEELTIDGR